MDLITYEERIELFPDKKDVENLPSMHAPF
jgi:hypothetical protein